MTDVKFGDARELLDATCGPFDIAMEDLGVALTCLEVIGGNPPRRPTCTLLTETAVALWHQCPDEYAPKELIEMLAAHLELGRRWTQDVGAYVRRIPNESARDYLQNTVIKLERASAALGLAVGAYERECAKKETLIRLQEQR